MFKKGGTKHHKTPQTTPQNTTKHITNHHKPAQSPNKSAAVKQEK